MLTIHHMRKLANADPRNLPILIVHNVTVWKGGAQLARTPDGGYQVHMNTTDYLVMSRELPLKRTGKRNADTFEAVIDLQRHHLLGGANDRATLTDRAARHGEVRELLGFDRVTGAPKTAAPKVVAGAGRSKRRRA